MTHSTDRAGAARDFEGKRVLVTGGTKGIGAATVLKFLEGGAKVAATARRKPKDLPAGVEYIQADLGTKEGVEAVVRRLTDMWQGVDILIHNVGASSSRLGTTAIHEDDADWVASLNLNVLAAVRLDRAFVPGMVERGSGVVIHVSSISRRYPRTNSSLAYASAKGALTTYSKGLSKAAMPKGVRVLMISPGLIETTGAHEMIEDIARRISVTPDVARKTLVDGIGGIPAGRMGRPEEVADLIVFLASRRADFICGVDYIIDGGTLPTMT